MAHSRPELLKTEDECPIIVRELPHEAVDFLIRRPYQSFFLTILAGSS